VISAAAVVEDISVRVCRFPTDAPEGDGTLDWDSTTAVIVELRAEGVTGLGWSYADAAAARIVADTLGEVVTREPVHAIPRVHIAMQNAVRNAGRPGVAACAISAVDVALWDLKARLAGLPLVDLIGRSRDAIPLYASGGFTSWNDDRLAEDFAAQVKRGLWMVKMKVGRDTAADARRVRLAREAIGDGPRLFVDANGAWTAKQALAMAEDFAECGVSWLEEPVSSDDLDGLRLLRERGPAGMEIAAGEYGYDSWYFARMIRAGAVDVLQADATRCCGITGFLETAALARANHLPLSSHCAPALHLHPCCAVPAAAHMEYFHDHVRIEERLFDGVPAPEAGQLAPTTAPGHGLSLNAATADRFAA